MITHAENEAARSVCNLKTLCALNSTDVYCFNCRIVELASASARRIEMVELVVGEFGFRYVDAKFTVWSQEQVGRAELARAEQNRQILITQANAEKEAAGARAEAIRTMGEMAKKYPEYRQQEFIGAFGEALKDGHVKLVFVPTERNIPILPSTISIED